MRGDTSEAVAAAYAAGLFGPYDADWRITSSAYGWWATRRDGAAGPPMTIVRDTARQLAEALAREAWRVSLRGPGGA